MKSRHYAAMFIFLAAAGALALRLPLLHVPPLHGDEANQAHKAGRLIESGEYRYDPVEHHGPTLYYLTLPIAWMQGADTFAQTSVSTYRIVPVALGSALILLLLVIRGPYGLGPAIWAAALIAISPAMVYYSRYYVHEMLLVFFTFAAIGCGWRYLQRPRMSWALALGAMIGMMHATKETCVVIWVAIACAMLAAAAWQRIRDGSWPAKLPGIFPEHVAGGLLMAVLVSVTLYSSFFTYWQGPLDSVRTYWYYVQRSAGEGSTAMHAKPWYYYLQLLAYTKLGPGPWWSEGVILLLGIAGIGSALFRKGSGDARTPLYRFLAFYAIAMVIAFSAIPYKTPWNMLCMLHALILVAGIGAGWLVRKARHPVLRGAVLTIAVLACVQLGVQAVRASYEYPADPRNPYAYAHTSSAFQRLVDRTQDLAAVHPEGHDMRMLVIAPNHDYWPLPFYLRQFPNAGFFAEVPDQLEADMIIVSTQLAQEVDDRMGETHISEMHSLRPAVLLVAFIEAGLWEHFMADRR